MQKSAAPSIFPAIAWPFAAWVQRRPSREPRAVAVWAQAGRETLIPPAARARMGVRALRLLRADD